MLPHLKQAKPETLTALLRLVRASSAAAVTAVAVISSSPPALAPACVAGIVAGMKPTFIALLVFSLCLVVVCGGCGGGKKKEPELRSEKVITPGEAANKLFVEAIELVNQAQAKENADISEAIKSYEKALSNVRAITSKYKESDIAVRLVSNEILFAGKTLAEINERTDGLRKKLAEINKRIEGLHHIRRREPVNTINIISKPARTNIDSNVTSALSNNATGTAINAPPPALVSETPEKTDILENDSVRYTFTSRGGGISRIELKNNQKVEFVMRLDRGRLPLMAVQPHNGHFNTSPESAPPYSIQRHNYELKKSKRDELTATTHMGPYQIKKIFSVKNQYQLEVKVMLSNNSPNQIPESIFHVISGTVTQPEGKRPDAGSKFVVVWFNGDEAEIVRLKWFGTKNNYSAGTSNVRWVGAINNELVQATMPNEPACLLRVNALRLDPLRPAENQFAYETTLGLNVPALGPYQQYTCAFTLYTGPRDYKRLKAIGIEQGNRFGLLGKLILPLVKTVR